MAGDQAIATGVPVGRYEIQSLLSASGMGDVYLARDAQLARDLVIKFLPRGGTMHPGALERFMREARSASALNHPNIVTVYEIGETERGHFIAMEYVQGHTLRAMQAERTSIPGIAKIGAQAARALAVAHAAGIVHRDVKPENVMVREDGYVKVLDFGIARLSHTDADNRLNNSRLTQPGMVVGTMRYMAPEQATAGNVTSASDIFSLGIVLYELAAGRHPFDSSSDMAVLSAIILRDTVPPSRINSRVPDAFDSLLMRMLSKNPLTRPSATEVSELCDSIASANDPRLSGTFASSAPGRVIGREPELQVLAETFVASASGKISLVCLSGEAGIGKTTVVEEFLRRLGGTTAYAVAVGRCSERLAGAEAYLPLLDAIDDLVRRDSTGAAARTVRASAPTWHGLMGARVSDPAAEGAVAPALSQERVKRELVAFLEEFSAATPLVLILEDLHWADVSTVDVLGYVFSRLRNCRVLAIVTYRPEELQLSAHPFLGLKLDLQTRGVARETPLAFLTREEVGRFVTQRFPEHELPPEFIDLIHARTEGNPLFVEDLLGYLRAKGAIIQNDGRWRLDGSLPDLERNIPESMRSMVQRKIGQLTDSEREILSVAAVQGHTFAAAVVARAMGIDPADAEDRLDVLDNVHSFVRRRADHEFADGSVSARYRFVHVLYQNALYNSLSTSRRVTLSRTVGTALLDANGGVPGSIAAELGFLFETARDHDRAARFFATAAHTAASAFATRETAALARRAIALVTQLETTPEREELELSLQLLLGYAIPSNDGYAAPEALAAMARAKFLAETLEDKGRLDPAMRGMRAYYLVSGSFEKAHEIARQSLALALETGDPVSLLGAYTSLGITTRHLARHREALHYFERAVEGYDPERVKEYVARYRVNPGLFCYSEMMRTLWYLGYQDRAEIARKSAMSIGRAGAEPRTLAFALLFSAIGRVLMRDPSGALEDAGEAISVCDEQGILQERGWAMCARGWALGHLGRITEGLADLEASIAIQRSTNAELNLPFELVQFAEVQMLAGSYGLARSTLADALGYSCRNGDVSDDSSIHRLTGDLELLDGAESGSAPPAAIAEQHYLKAIATARESEALSLELRAAVSLAELYRDQNRRADGRRILAQVRGRFTEGFGMRDLLETDRLLADLG